MRWDEMVYTIGFDEVPVSQFKSYLDRKMKEWDNPFVFNVSYAPYTEYGTPPITPASDVNVVDSTAIVIDPDVKALPEPKEG